MPVISKLDPNAGINEATMPQGVIDLLGLLPPDQQIALAPLLIAAAASQRAALAPQLLTAALAGPVDPALIAQWTLLSAVISSGH